MKSSEIRQQFLDFFASKGHTVVASSPLTRSSHHAGDDFAKLRAARESLLNKIL